MTTSVVTGLERLLQEKNLQDSLKGNIGYLCHSASITSHYEIGVVPLQKIFGQRFKKLFGPQHGFLCNVQDNMIESQDFFHPFFKVPVHSLYSHTRAPSLEMLEGLNTLIVDLQDVGTRVYTYFSTLSLLMEVCSKHRPDLEIVVLDRPNPVGGIKVEGNLLKPHLTSFVGRHPVPQRHGLTMGELALLAQKYFGFQSCSLRVVPMLNWKRTMSFPETKLPWVWPSPNLPTWEGAYTFVGTVLFEGTNISEGRGTTRSLEIVGHPDIEPFSLLQPLQERMKREGLEGFVLRPIIFQPTFQKHQGTPCGGFQIHVTNVQQFESWHVGQVLCQEFYHHLGEKFQWKNPPYEYEYDRMPIDLINGDERVRTWVEKKESLTELRKIEMEGMNSYRNQRDSILIYS